MQLKNHNLGKTSSFVYQFQIHHLIIPSILVICATIGAAVIAIVDALSKTLFAEVKLADIIPDFGLGELIWLSRVEISELNSSFCSCLNSSFSRNSLRVFMRIVSSFFVS